MNSNSFVFGTFQMNDKHVLKQLFVHCLDIGINTIDTAPSYKTEKMLGEIFSDLGVNKGAKREHIIVQTKIDGWQMQTSGGQVQCYVKEALRKMQLSYIDTMLVHWPFPDYLSETWNSLYDLKNKGLIKRIGLCNVRKRHVHKLNEETSILPDVIQIERHPLRNANEDIKYFHHNNITVQAYSPLCRMDDRVRNSELLKKIAGNHGRSLVQIVMRWHYQSGVVPVFMTTKLARIKDNTEIFGFDLSNEEMNVINNMNINYKVFIESRCCPGF